MPFELRTSYEAKYVEVRYEGEVTAAERVEAMDQVFSQAETLDFHRALIDFRDAHCVTEDFAASNRVASRLARATVDKGWRVAYVNTLSLQMDPAVERLAEARDVPFKCFRHRITALAWLLTKRPH